MRSLGSRLLGAYVYLLIAVILSPLVVVVLVSLNPGNTQFLPNVADGLSFRWWNALFSNQRFIAGFQRSVILAIIAASSAIAIGWLAAYATVRYRFPGRDALQALILLPIVVPDVITGLALLQLLAGYGLNGSFIGLLVGHVLLCLPYSYRVLTAALLGVDPEYEQAARDLGAGRLAVLLRITLPLMLPGLLAASAFVFLMSFDTFTISLFLGGHTFTTLPIEMYIYISEINDPMAAAVSSVMMVLSILVVLVIERILGLRKLLLS